MFDPPIQEITYSSVWKVLESVYIYIYMYILLYLFMYRVPETCSWEHAWGVRLGRPEKLNDGSFRV